MMNFHTHGDEGNTVPLQLLAETVDYKYPVRTILITALNKNLLRGNY